MLSLVNYGGSDSEDEISDEEENAVAVQFNGNKRDEEIEDLITQTKSSTIQLPKPSSTTLKTSIAEEEDEFLHKREVPTVVPPKREKVKIMIPRLSDFKDDEDDKKSETKIQPANRKTGLLSMLPRPSCSFAPAPRPSTTALPIQQPKVHEKSATEISNLSSEAPKKVGFIPYTLMSHKPKTSEEKNPSKKPKEEDSDDDDEPTGSFFSFASQEDDSALPHVSQDEVQALVAKQTEKMEQRKRQAEETVTSAQYQEEVVEYQQQEQNIDEEAMRQLLGGNRAKRSRTDNIQIIDLSAAEVMPNRDEWVRKTLAGETSYMATGKINEKVKVLINGKLSFFVKKIIFYLGIKFFGEEKASNLFLINAS